MKINLRMSNAVDYVVYLNNPQDLFSLALALDLRFLLSFFYAWKSQ